MNFEAHARRILVIRLGALGDLLLCAPAFQAIRDAHPRAQIALLTQPQWVDFGRSMPWFDHIISDSRPHGFDMAAWWDLLRRLREFEMDMVYDLQGKQRQNIIFWLLGGPKSKIAWSGANRFCRYPRAWPPQPGWHFQDFIAAQLHIAGVEVPAKPDFSWLSASVEELSLPEKYGVIIPGCSASRPEKRWPPEYYAQVAKELMNRGLSVIAIGAKDDRDAITAVKARAPGVIDLGGRTSLLQIGTIARNACVVIGNDTGPSHIAAAVGSPTLTLFAATVNPVWSRPQGPCTAFLQADPISALTVAQVMDSIGPWFSHDDGDTSLSAQNGCDIKTA